MLSLLRLRQKLCRTLPMLFPKVLFGCPTPNKPAAFHQSLSSSALSKLSSRSSRPRSSLTTPSRDRTTNSPGFSSATVPDFLSSACNRSYISFWRHARLDLLQNSFRWVVQIVFFLEVFSRPVPNPSFDFTENPPILPPSGQGRRWEKSPDPKPNTVLAAPLTVPQLTVLIV